MISDVINFFSGVTVPVEDLQDDAVCHLVDAAIADHLRTVLEKSFLMPMGESPW